MVKVQEHKNKMEQIHKEIKKAKGYRKKDLIRQYNKMYKQLMECNQYLMECQK